MNKFKVYKKGKKDEEIEHYDVCVLGGGPAGLTAGIYTGRYGLKTGLITKDIGGMANLAAKIENYPGYEGSGLKLMKKFHEQARKAGTEFLEKEARDLKKDDTGYIIELDGKVVHSKTLIIASGTKKRKLEIPGEEEFLGKGVSYCATCDAAFFRNKNVAVIGGRNSAAKAALILSKIAKKVYIVYRKEKLNCDEIEKEKIKQKDNIELVLNSVPKKILGNKFVNKFEIESKGKEKKGLNVEGVFIEIGAIPVKAITTKLGIDTNEEGYIKVDNQMRTSQEGVFAAGDTVKSPIKQVVISAGQGAIAAHSAKDYLSKK